MTLDEAIIKFKEEATKLMKEYDYACALNLSGSNLDVDAEEQQQLADWLTELKSLRETSKTMSWIPVSERLPDKNGRYLITNYNLVCLRRFSVTRNEFGYFDDTDESYDSRWISIPQVTAWMPLPESYPELDKDQPTMMVQKREKVSDSEYCNKYLNFKPLSILERCPLDNSSVCNTKCPHYVNTADQGET